MKLLTVSFIAAGTVWITGIMASTIVSDALWEFLKELVIFLVLIVSIWNRRKLGNLKEQNDEQSSKLEEALDEVRTNTRITMKIATEYAANRGKSVEDVLRQDHALLDSLITREKEENAEEKEKHSRSPGGRNTGIQRRPPDSS